MTKLYNEHEDLRDKFEFIAFHDARATDLADLDEKLADVVEKRWNGKPLPFPILMDETGQTIKDFGIASYPTVILINPEGKLVKGGGEHMMKKILDEMAGGE